MVILSWEQSYRYGYLVTLETKLKLARKNMLYVAMRINEFNIKLTGPERLLGWARLKAEFQRYFESVL
jgi:hypothetical protein